MASQKEDVVPKYFKIREYLRTIVASGEFRPGDCIPGEHALARQFGVNHWTVNKAIHQLVQEGVLYREQGRGTFVTERPSWKFVGLFFGDDVFNQPGSRFSPMLARAAERFFRSNGYEVKFYIQHEHLLPQGIANRDLSDDLEKRVLSGLISVGTSDPAKTFLSSTCWRKCRVPYVGITSTTPNRVQTDLRALIRLGLDYLQQRNCRSVGVIGYAIGAPGEEIEFLRSEIQNRGFRMRDEWLPIAPLLSEEHGYDSMLRLWRCSEKPESLLILDDIMGKGAAQAMLHLRIEVPNSLTVICQTNRGSGIFYPIPMARIENDPAEIMEAAGQLLLEQIRNPHQPPRAIILPPRLRLESEAEAALKSGDFSACVA